MSAGGRQDASRRERRRTEREDFQKLITDRLGVIRAGPYDVLVLHLPPAVIADQSKGGLFQQAQEGAMEVMVAAKRPVVLLPEGTSLTAESILPFLPEEAQESPVFVPPKEIVTPRGIHAVPDPEVEP